MPTRRQLIQKITLNADASSVTFSDIPQNYTDLRLVASARSTQAAAATNMRMTFNGSSSGYNERVIYGDSVGASSYSNSSVTLFTIGLTSAASSTSNTFGFIEINIPNYNSSNNKSLISKYLSENNSSTQNTAYIGQLAGLWANSSAISSISFTLASGNYAANSTFYLYGITHVPIIRGGEVSIANGFKIHTFKSTASLQVIEGGNVEYLVLAGGGGGGGSNGAAKGGGGGGGAGGYISSVSSENSGGGTTSRPRLQLTPGKYSITVGGGGPGGTNSAVGTQGSNSVLSIITASGGGYGGMGWSAGSPSIGGSGGGGGGATSGTSNGASGISGQGYSGGNNFTGIYYMAGGGGGAGSAGSNGTSTLSGNGGSGISSSITGTSISRAGGGGGGQSEQGSSAGSPGTATSGGGAGGANTFNGSSGLLNTGGGGGGTGGNASDLGGAGGSGIVIIRYPYDGN